MANIATLKLIATIGEENIRTQRQLQYPSFPDFPDFSNRFQEFSQSIRQTFSTSSKVLSEEVAPVAQHQGLDQALRLLSPDKANEFYTKLHVIMAEATAKIQALLIEIDQEGMSAFEAREAGI